MITAGKEEVASVERELEEALHQLAQPLTALAFLTEISALQREPATWKAALEAAATETRRAMECLRRTQAAAARLTEGDGGNA